MSNPLSDISQWRDLDSLGNPGASPPLTWNSTDNKYEFVTSGSTFNLGLIYTGTGITNPFIFTVAQPSNSDHISIIMTVVADNVTTPYTIVAGAPATLITINPCTTLQISFNDIISTAYIQPIALPKTLIYGYSINAIGNTQFNDIIKLTENIDIDTTFTPIVLGDSNDNIITSHITNDGKIYVGGRFSTVNGNPYSNIMRLNSDGTLDTSFVDLALMTDMLIVSIIQTSDNKIYIGGESDSGDALPPILIRLNSDGTLDTTFTQFIATNNNDSVQAITQTTDGKIYFGGGNPASSHGGVRRLNSDGTLDVGYGTLDLITGWVDVIIELQSGEILVGSGYSGGDNVQQLVVLDSNGILNSVISMDSNTVYTLMQSTDGKIYVGGGFGNPVDGTYNNLVRYNSDMTLDTTFVDLGLSNDVSYIKQLSNGYICIASGTDIYLLESDGTLITIISKVTLSGGSGYGLINGLTELANETPTQSPTPTPSPTSSPTSSPTPTPTPVVPTPTPTPNNQSSNMKQMFRRYSDGTLVARDQQYDLLRGFQFIQYVESSTWEVCHNMQSDKFNQAVLVNNILVDCEVQIIDKCKILLHFATPVSGYANFVFLDTFPTTTICSCIPSETPTTTSTPTPTPSITPSTPVPTIFASTIGNLNMGSEGYANMVINLYSTSLCNESRTPLITTIINVAATWTYYNAGCNDPLISAEDVYCQPQYTSLETIQNSGSFSFVPSSNNDGTYSYTISSNDGATDLLDILLPSSNKLVIMDLLVTTNAGTLTTQLNYDVWGC